MIGVSALCNMAAGRGEVSFIPTPNSRQDDVNRVRLRKRGRNNDP